MAGRGSWANTFDPGARRVNRFPCAQRHELACYVSIREYDLQPRFLDRVKSKLVAPVC